MESPRMTSPLRAAIKENVEYMRTNNLMRLDLELEIAARKEKLRAMCEAQCASLRARLERRVNRIPSNMRGMNIVDLLQSAVPETSATHPKPAAAAPVRGARNAQTTRDVTRDTQQAPPARQVTTKTTTKPATKPVTTNTIKPSTTAAIKPSTSTTIKPSTTAAPQPSLANSKRVKRTSDEISTSGKDTAAEDLAVPRKRARAVAPAPPKASTAATVNKPAVAPAATKAAATRKTSATRSKATKGSTDDISGSGKENAGELAVPRVRAKAAATAPARQTRAVSKKTAPAEVLSPKSHNSRPIRTTRATRRPA